MHDRVPRETTDIQFDIDIHGNALTNVVPRELYS